MKLPSFTKVVFHHQCEISIVIHSYWIITVNVAHQSYRYSRGRFVDCRTHGGRFVDCRKHRGRCLDCKTHTACSTAHVRLVFSISIYYEDSGGAAEFTSVRKHKFLFRSKSSKHFHCANQVLKITYITTIVYRYYFK